MKLAKQRRCCVIVLCLAGLMSVPSFAPVTTAQPRKSALQFVREGESALGRRRYQEAVYLFHQAIQRNQRSAAAHLGAARSYLALSQTGRAAEHYRKVLELDDENLDARVGLARTHSLAGNFAAAEKLLKEVRAKDPGNVANNHAFGVFYYLRGNYRLAEGYFQRAIRVQPTHVGSLVGLALTTADQERLDLAEDYLRRARQIDQNDPRIYAAQAHMELRRAFSVSDEEERGEHLDLAHAALLKAEKLAPDDRDVQGRLIRIDLYRNRSEAALRRANALEDVRADPDLLYMIAALRLRSGGSSVRDGVRDLQRALAIDPGNSLTRFSLEEAVIHHARLFPPAGSLRRELARYHYDRARYYRSRNRRDVMNTHLRRSLELYPYHQGVLRIQLEDYRRAGDYENFLRILQRLRGLHPNDARLHNRLERALREKNEALPYRENLLFDEATGGAGTYRRTPVRVLVFDIRPEDQFPLHPDGADRVAQGLMFELDRPGPVRSVSSEFRTRVLSDIRQSGAAADNGRYAYGIYYSPRFAREIGEQEKRSRTKVDYIVSGSYRITQGGEGIRISYSVTEKNTASPIDRFTVEGRGRDAIYHANNAAAVRLRARLAPHGKIIKVKPGSIYVNLGAIDGIKKGQRLTVSRLGAPRGRLRVVETATYIARCAPVEGGAWDRYDPEDVVRPE